MRFPSLFVVFLLGSVLRAAPSSEEAALERSLASVRAENICADVRFIASDELGGRDTPSEGQRLAARFLRARLERLGLEPAGDDGYFDRYPLERSGMDVDNSKAWVVRGSERRELAFGSDYSFFGGGEHELEGALVYVGGASAAELAGRDLAGRWALLIDAPSVRFDRAERAARAERVQAAGALGLVSGVDPSAKEAAESDARMARFASFARSPGLRTPGDSRSSSGDFPSVGIASSVVRDILGSGPPPAVGQELAVRFGERRKRLVSETLELENVAALHLGSDEKLRSEVIVLSAHYDHVGTREGEIYNGADDNGSGTCALLAVAEGLARRGPLRRSVLLLWVSGEEKGLLGSEAWTKDPTLPAGMRAVCNLNVDMVGRNAPDELLITPTQALPEYNGLTRLAEKLAPLEGFPKLGGCDDFWGRSDQMNFAQNLKIPVAFLFSGEHEDYHRPSDDVEKLDCDKVGRDARLLLRMLDGLQGDVLLP